MRGELDPETEINAFLRELDDTIGSMTPEERAYKIVKLFFQTEEPTEKIHTMFFEWMLSPVDEDAKRYAMERVLKECLDGTMHLEGPQNRNL